MQKGDLVHKDINMGMEGQVLFQFEEEREAI